MYSDSILNLLQYSNLFVIFTSHNGIFKLVSVKPQLRSCQWCAIFIKFPVTFYSEQLIKRVLPVLALVELLWLLYKLPLQFAALHRNTAGRLWTCMSTAHVTPFLGFLLPQVFWQNFHSIMIDDEEAWIDLVGTSDAAEFASIHDHRVYHFLIQICWNLSCESVVVLNSTGAWMSMFHQNFSFQHWLLNHQVPCLSTRLTHVRIRPNRCVFRSCASHQGQGLDIVRARSNVELRSEWEWATGDRDCSTNNRFVKNKSHAD